MKKRFLVLLMVMMMVISAAGCSKESASNGESKDTLSRAKTLTLHDSEWMGTDLFCCSSWYTSQNLISDTFLIQDPNDPSKLLPNICSDYKVSEDGMSFRLTFPEDMKFADGTPLGPEDFIASIEYGLEDRDGDGEPDSDWGYGYSNIKSMEVDGRDVICYLSEYRSDLEYFLTQPFMGIISKKQLESMSRDELLWGALPYGQFYVDEFVPGSHVILKPNPYYMTSNPLVENKGPSRLESITVKIADVEAFTLNTAIKEGDIDILTGINMEQYAELSRADDITILDVTFPNIEYFELNQDSKHLRDIRVRKAIMKALDRDAMEVMCQGSFKPEYAMITSVMQNYSQKAEEYFKKNLSNDIEGAKALLAEAGYTINSDGFLYKDGEKLSFNFLARSSGTSVTVAQELQLQLKEIGIDMSIETIDWNYIYEKINADDYDAGIEVLQWGEPILILNYCYYDLNSKSKEGFQAYKDLVNQCVNEPDSDKRTQLISDIQMSIFEDCAMVPLYSDVEYCAYRNDIEGLLVTENGSIYYNDIK
ncbi:ABC transporter substrate-binding protein [Tissierella carlieri]|uniref:ABC transporter substrate-binding protein n=1 Tax=Tissierella carlieri TaxID=689904 RepID=A0ABT1S7M5_9FIRM|nr:ABC transporter substrate-binding protein [Tissierella carlieri]MCQ4922459.1 ABC transporter substrate-binding protein [Tissierella carlieri]